MFIPTWGIIHIIAAYSAASMNAAVKRNPNVSHQSAALSLTQHAGTPTR